MFLVNWRNQNYDLMKNISAFLFFALLHAVLAGQTTKIVVVNDSNAFKATVTAVSAWGGLTGIVKPGQRVGLLINSDFDEKGAYVDPEVSIAAVKLCFDAGASEVICLQAVKPTYWQKAKSYPQHEAMIARVKNVEKNSFPAKYDSVNFTRLDTIPGAVELRNVEVVSELFKVEVFINIPIAKHHATTILTCAMKNLMGLCTRATNVTMHLNGPKRNDPVYLAQCITDIFAIRKPDLTIVDAQAGIVTNGPAGPGEMVHPGKVVVGVDVVAIDAYCADLLGFPMTDVPTLSTGEAAKLGIADLRKVTVIEK